MIFSTRDEAIQRLIIDPIEAGDATASEFNIEMIADKVLGGYNEGYACQVDDIEFWEIVTVYSI